MQKMPKVPFWVFILLAALYFLAIGVNTMDVDASQYAEMSREMSSSKNPLQLYDRGNNYLDKPPFLFWASGLSIKFFGPNNFGFKFPSILFALWALYATYRLGKRLYDGPTGRLAALVLGCCQGMFLMTNDIRTDTILMSWVITAIWMIKEAELKRTWKNVLGGTFAIACGMMTKGPIALMVPLFCFGSDWLLKRKWKKIFDYSHVLDAVLIAIFLIPMSIGLYRQYDMHPETEVNGQTGVSGLKFFYWTQSFGRITGESSWDNGAPFSFLYENMAWSFLPWVLLFTASLAINIWTVIRQRSRLNEQQEYITTGGFLLAYLSLALSKYQLPHYIFVVFPLAAIMTAKLLSSFSEGKFKDLYRGMKAMQYFISAVLLIAAFLTFFFVFKTSGVWYWLFAWIVLVSTWLFIVFSKKITGKIVWVSAAAIMIANVFMSLHFYPQLLKYQVGSQMGRYIKANLQKENVYAYYPEDPLNSICFYADRMISLTYEPKPADYILTMQKGLDALKANGTAYDIVKTGRYFAVSQLTPKFLNPETREAATRVYYLVKVR
ncbi:MAG TPA: glycosyltransferase family 39 protein [Flavipsychrobacter sp.]|nr:glycosyltransferase family 39 protein [Flavipsychrobacter sp.]